MRYRISFLLVLGYVVCLTAEAQSSMSLQEALKAARVNNLFLKTERYTIEAGQADVVSAKLRPNPALNNQTLQLANSKYYAENTAWNSPHNRQVWWQLTKPFQLPNQRKYRIDVANQGYNLINKNFLELERNVFFDVASKWLDVWIAQNQIRVIEIAKNNADTLAKINALRLKNQVISETDLIRTQLLSEQYAVQLKSVRQDLLNKRSQLRFLIGTTDSVDVDLTNEFLFPESINIDTLLRYALANRSDIQQIQSLITLSESNIKFQKSMALPQPELGMIWNPQNTVPYVGFFGTIELPIFSRNQGEIQKSTILKRQAEQNYVTVQTQIQTEINTAYKSFIVQQQNVERFTGILQQAQSILDRVRYAYLRGGTTIIDFLEAQRSWLETQQQYYDAQQQYRQSYIQLLFVSGLINKLAQ